MTEIQRKAMQIALYALEKECAIYKENDPEDGEPEHIYEAIIALRSALEDIQTDCDLSKDGVCERLECPSCCAEPLAYYDPTDTRVTRSQSTLTVSAETNKISNTTQEIERDAGWTLAELPFAWATFDGEGGYYLRLYEGNEKYKEEFVARNGDKYSDWVIPLYEDMLLGDMENEK